MGAVDFIQQIAIAALPVVLAITLHEAAHGYVAKHFGDPTAYMLGRITANPIKHIDPIGTILVPLLILLFSSGGIWFGWAKPVPVNYGNLRQPKRDMLWVAAAGPGSNLLMALFWALVLKFSSVLAPNYFSDPMQHMAVIGVGINVSLMVLNLFPLPPLDGGRIAVSLLPPRAAWQYSKIEPWGFPILLVLLYTGVLGTLLYPIMGAVMNIIKILI